MFNRIKSVISLTLIFIFMLVIFCACEKNKASSGTHNNSQSANHNKTVCSSCGSSFNSKEYRLCPECYCEDCGRKKDGLTCGACKRDQGYTTLQSSLVQIKSGTDKRYRTVDACALEQSSFMASDHDISVTNQSDDYLPTLKKNHGDELIVTQSYSEMEVYPVIGDYYCYPAEFISADFYGLNFRTPYLDVPDFDYKYIAELNGVDVTDSSDEEINAILEDAGCFLLETWPNSWLKNEKFFVSDKPTTLLMGYWEGVSWRETSIDMSGYKLYEFGSCIKLPVEKTKNGYFIIDTSQLSAGTYAIRTNSSFISIGSGAVGLQLFCVED